MTFELDPGVTIRSRNKALMTGKLELPQPALGRTRHTSGQLSELLLSCLFCMELRDSSGKTGVDVVGNVHIHVKCTRDFPTVYIRDRPTRLGN